MIEEREHRPWECGREGLEAWFLLSLVVWPWAGDFISLSFSPLTCKMGIKTGSICLISLL